MKLTQTAKIKLSISKEDILPTMQAYTAAFNYASEIAFSNKITQARKLQKLVYYPIKQQFGLHAQLTSSVIAKVIEAVKSALKKTAHKKYRLLSQEPTYVY